MAVQVSGYGDAKPAFRILRRMRLWFGVQL
jgi:hypothetical protein